MEACLRAVVAIRVYGFGKVHLVPRTYCANSDRCVRLVQPDADFECISVLMERIRDVKCIAWHLREEVCLIVYPHHPTTIL